MKTKLNTDFMLEISKTRDMGVFFGIARLLKVKVVDLSDKTKPVDDLMRPFEDIFADMVAAFDKLPRAHKRNLLKVMREAN